MNGIFSGADPEVSINKENALPNSCLADAKRLELPPKKKNCRQANLAAVVDLICSERRGHGDPALEKYYGIEMLITPPS